MDSREGKQINLISVIEENLPRDYFGSTQMGKSSTRGSQNFHEN